jgi:hypothetical protein
MSRHVTARVVGRSIAMLAPGLTHRGALASFAKLGWWSMLGISMVRHGRVLRVIAVTVLASLVFASPASAREAVDPSTLTPPPPPEFNAVCERTGNQIICSLAFSDPDVVAEPSGVVCGSTELLFSVSRSVVGKRYYDSEGSLLTRHFREWMTGSFTNPVTGKVATLVAHDTVMHRLATPGDVTTGTESISGLQNRITGPDGNTILVDAGRVVLDESTGDFIASHGPHHFDDYFARGGTHALDPLCAALA